MKKIFMMTLGFLFVASVSFAADVQNNGRTFSSPSDLSIDQSVTCDADPATTFCSGTATHTWINSNNVRYYIRFWAPDSNATYYWLYFLSDTSGTVKYSNLANIKTLGSAPTSGDYSINIDRVIVPGDYTLTSIIMDSAGKMAISQPHRFTAY